MKPKTKAISLYFHSPCFDGLVSGVLVSALLEKHEGWRIKRFCPINYDARDSWLATRLSTPCAIVDFLYHPQAFLWADHHISSFVNADAKQDFRLRNGEPYLWFDQRATSCSSILWRHLSVTNNDENARYRQMVKWANKIDSASYHSAEEAIFGEEPALRVNLSLFLDDQDTYSLYLLEKLRVYDLSEVAELSEVKSRYQKVRRKVLNGLKRVKSSIMVSKGDIAFFDVTPHNDEMISRYAPYLFSPGARYSVGVVRTDRGVKITAMRNPWITFDSIPLGRMFERFGGGGHQRVAAVSLPKGHGDRAKTIVSEVISRMQEQAVVEV